MLAGGGTKSARLGCVKEEQTNIQRGWTDGRTDGWMDGWMDRDEHTLRGWSRKICKLQSRLLNRKGQEQREGEGEVG
ncbi:hypothetical protein WH47_11160 [Habropoda laboriosa]|uniref:Uncharacterized protein n=1 Tax=Habropoda laboriosa TaxID=597456 RepID=A0A0L7RA89_9HYME|nr:hypothetical protein WH47_11160 [Habropoda laboriosa]